MKACTLTCLAVFAVVLAGCDIGGPSEVPDSPLTASAGEDQVVSPDSVVQLSGKASGGIPPYTYRWNLEDQPDAAAVDLPEDSTNSDIELGPLAERGRYLVRLRVTDSSGSVDMSYVAITVGGDLTVTAETSEVLRLVGETAELSYTITDDTTDFEDITYKWEIIDGEAELSADDVEAPELTVLSNKTVKVRFTYTATSDDEEVFGMDDVYVVGIGSTTPQVSLVTSGAADGTIILELLTESAPLACANFLHYVDDGFYDGIVWHRVVQDFVIQAGAYERVDGELVEREGTRAAITGEAPNDQSNVRGTVAMALRGSDADSATNQFFINLIDNSENLDDGPPAFTVFANVVVGMDVVDEIAGVEVSDSDPSGLTDVPVEDVVINSIQRSDAVEEELSFKAAGSDTTARFFHAATLLDDGKVMVTGGMKIDVATISLQSLSSVSFYDPETREFSDTYEPADGGDAITDELATARSSHTQTTLPDGRVLITGGYADASGTDQGERIASVEIFDANTVGFYAGPDMAEARGRHTATMLSDGNVLVAGGGTDSWQLFSYKTDTWSGNFSLQHSRAGHTAVLLADFGGVAGDDRVLLIGGDGSGPDTMELVDPAAGTTALLESTLPTGVDDLAAIQLADGRVLIVGGQDASSGDTISDCYLLDPEADTIEETASLPDRDGGISDHKIFRSDRYVVVFGGEQQLDGEDTELDYVAVYDSEAQEWTDQTSMLHVHDDFAAVDLGDCSVLIIGGGIPLLGQEGPSSTAEVFSLNIDEECIGDNAVDVVETIKVVISNSGGVTGDIVIELFPDAAPNTVDNFLRYVDEGFYDGITWHRVVSGFVIQGGAYEPDTNELIARDGVHDAIASEANNGYSNVEGMVAMALRGTDADSATNQFFINLADNSTLDDGEPPFTVFGQVVEGMDIVQEIAAVEVGDDPSGLTNVPVVDIVMTVTRQ